MPKLVSAGILLYRSRPTGREVFLVHPGGPFWAKKDDGAWSIPKGRADPDEDLAATARREFAEEVGVVPPGELIPLGDFKQPSGKIVVAFALEGDFDPARLVSNTVEVEWPPRSGISIAVPEVDRAAWYGLPMAGQKILRGQAPILAAFQARIG